MSDTDAALLRRFIRNGEEAAFRTLYDAHTPRLYLLALRLLANRSAAEDAVQETWLRAARAGRDFAGRSTFGTWLAGILINCCREEKRRTSRLQLDWKTEIAGFDEQVLDLERSIRELPDGYRQVLVLHDLEGYTHEEIAELLQIDSGTSKSQLARARERVRARLTEVRGGLR